MEHIYHNIKGWWGSDNASYYTSIVDRFPGPAHFVEVGSFEGKSSSYMAVEIANSNKDIKFDCVDTWLGSPDTASEPSVIDGTLYENFIRNMQPLEEYYTPVRMLSVEAAATYQDKSLDFVFIDASHDYDSVKADIAAWHPKIKVGGIISGHDAFHPPVINAVNDSLTNVEIHGGCWHHIVT